MDNTAEGIGGRKWSFDRVSESGHLTLERALTKAGVSMPREDYEKLGEALGPQRVVRLQQGAIELAALTEHGEKVKMLLATAPQLWEAANALVALARRAPEAGAPEWRAAEQALANMVAKAVGKQDWKDVEQA